MTKRIALSLLAVILLFSFASCSKSGYPDLPWDATKFEYTDYMAKPGLDYSSIKWGDRVYLPYAYADGEIKADYVTDCLGYTSYNGEDSKNERVFTIKGDSEHNFLLIMTVGTKNAARPQIFRALDSKGKNVFDPGYPQERNYDDVWKD